MAVKLKRKLYARGGSFETTVPIQLLFSLDLSKKHDVLFEFDSKTNKWFLSFKESDDTKKSRR